MRMFICIFAFFVASQVWPHADVHPIVGIALCLGVAVASAQDIKELFK